MGKIHEKTRAMQMCLHMTGNAAAAGGAADGGAGATGVLQNRRQGDRQQVVLVLVLHMVLVLQVVLQMLQVMLALRVVLVLQMLQVVLVLQSGNQGTAVICCR